MTRLTTFTLALAGLAAGTTASAADDPVQTLPEVVVTASRLGTGITGASTSIITSEDIERSPSDNLPDLLSREAGIQVQHTFGTDDGSRSVVDMRGFGASAPSNVLVLINGRRINELDQAGIDWAAIPMQGIERIEVTRGGAASVLYGDGAVGGAINIVTKNPLNTPDHFGATTEVGSYGYLKGTVSASKTVGSTGMSLYGSEARSDGYRQNNALKERNMVAEVRQALDRGDIYANLAVDDQHIGLPGGRTVTATTNPMLTDRKGAATPTDWADKQGINATLGFTHEVADGAELVVDGGLRYKTQQFWATGTFADTTFTTLSLTPRLNLDHHLFGDAAKGIYGIDLYQMYYDSDRSDTVDSRPYHRYSMQQRTVAAYGQETVAIRPDTDISGGLRIESATVTGKDHYDATAATWPFPAYEIQPLDRTDTNYAMHLGIEHRPVQHLALFGRIGRSLRLPNVDERIGGAAPGTFDLKPQTSYDAEVGTRLTWTGVTIRSSVYAMRLRDELHYDPTTFTNVNLDPTQRYGWENSANWRIAKDLALRGGFAFTQATYREGQWSGNEVPLVAHWTANAGVSWDIVEKLVLLDADLRYLGPRRRDNDQSNSADKIPSVGLVDVKLSGSKDWARWSLSVQNLFDVKYYDYSIASTATPGNYSAYPLPGRTVIGMFGVSF